MRINLNYRNLEAKRFSTVGDSVSINNNSTLTDVADTNNRLSISFIFTSNYEPNIGIIRIEGELNIDDSKDNITRAVEEWERSNKKSLPVDIAEKVHNTILSNCMVEATILSREVQLPAPLPTPNVSIKTGTKPSDENTRGYIR